MITEFSDNAGIDFTASKFPFAANGRALSLNQTAGFLKLIMGRLQTAQKMPSGGMGTMTVDTDTVLHMERLK